MLAKIEFAHSFFFFLFRSNQRLGLCEQRLQFGDLIFLSERFELGNTRLAGLQLQNAPEQSISNLCRRGGG